MLAQEISLKKSKTLYLFLSLLFTGLLIYFLLGPYEDTRIIFENSLIFSIILTIVFAIVIISCWYNFFNNASVVTFGVEGITYYKELTKWENIKSFKTVNYVSDSMDELKLVLTLFDTDKEYKISLFGLETNKEHIRTCIRYTSNIAIVDEGHSG